MFFTHFHNTEDELRYNFAVQIRFLQIVIYLTSCEVINDNQILYIIRKNLLMVVNVD